VPDGLGLPAAAALLHDGSTEVGLLGETGVQPGEHVLVTAAAGGMGVLLVQLALAAGGQVIGAARGERKLAAVRQAGGQAVDYSEPGWTGRVLELTGGQGVDVVFDGAGGELGAASFGIVARGGRFSAHGMSDGGFARLDPAEAGRRGVTVTGIGEYEPAVFRRRAGRGRGRADQAGHRAGVPAGRHGRRARRPGVEDRRGQDPAASLTAPRHREFKIVRQFRPL